MTPAELARALDARAADVGRALLGEPPQATRTAWRFGRRGSLALDVAGPKRGRWFDHEAGEGGDLLALAVRHHGGDFGRGADWARRFLGLPARDFAAVTEAPALPRAPNRPAAAPDALAARKMEAARRLWREALPIAGTIAESYLASRGIRLAEWPDALRFHPACGRRSASSPDAIERHPAMLGRMRDAETGEPLGVHRTYLRPDGSDRLRDDGGKKMLGRNGVVMLTEPEGVTLGLHLTEGIESGCAALAVGLAPCWAATSAGAIARFPILPGIEALTILADSDDVGIRAARACATRWRAAGREARILRPRRDGADMNDVVRQVAA